MLDRKKTLPKLGTFVLDMACIFFCMLYNLAIHGPYVYVDLASLLFEYKVILAIYLTIAAFMLVLFKCYEELIREFTLFGGLKVAGALCASNLVFMLLTSVLGQDFSFALMINSIIYSIFICELYRLLVVAGLRLSYLNPVSSFDEQRVIIFGAGDAGKYLVDMLRSDKSKKMRPVVFMDDNPNLEGKRIKGLLVFGPRELIPYAARKYKAEEIIIAIPFVDNTTIREIFNLCCEANCKVRRFGNLSSFTFDGLTKATINEVCVEDLLGREVVKLDLESVTNLIKNKTILITGGAGSIGSELCRQTLQYGAKMVILFDFSENMLFEITSELRQNYPESRFVAFIGSIRDRDRLEEAFVKYHPQVVFHAAAHKHVPLMEGNPQEALINNIIGTMNVAKAAIEHSVDRFILISTDKAVNPTNIMGATKRIAELFMQRKNLLGATLFTVVRFGNVLGSNGSVVSVFKKQIQAGGPLTVTDKEIKRYFMTIPEAVQLVLEACSISKGGEIFVLDMGEPVKIYDLATTMIKLSGLEVEKDIKIEITGLRPGEKLFEEISLSDETVTKTSKDRVFILKSDMAGDGQITEDLDKLCDCIVKRDFPSAYKHIKKLIPSFTNNIVD